MLKPELESVVLSTEYDFLRTNQHLNKNIILLGLGGSHAYGTNVEGSDIDLRGVALNSKKEILLGKDFEQVINTDTDTTIYSFNKITKLLTENNPNTLEIIFQRPEDFLVLTPIGQKLVENRHIFLSQKVYHTFGGYADAQLRRLDNKTMRSLSQSQQEQHILDSIVNAKYSFHERYFEHVDDAIELYIDKAIQENFDTEIFMDITLKHYPLRDYKCMWSEMHNIVKDYGKIGKRAANAIAHDKVNKHAMHLVRLMKAGIKILKTGDFCTYCNEDHDLLMDIRNGKYMGSDKQMTDEFFAMVRALRFELERALRETEIPEKPNYEAIENLICEVNEMVVREK